jgi:hypothetical protein
MKSIKPLFCGIICLLLGSSLVGCGEETEYPEMDKGLLDFIPYEPNQEILFANEEGDTLTFVVEGVVKGTVKRVDEYYLHKHKAYIGEISVHMKGKPDILDFSIIKSGFGPPYYSLFATLGSVYLSSVSDDQFDDDFLMITDTITLSHNGVIHDDFYGYDDDYVKIVRNKGIIEIGIVESRFGIHRYTWKLLERETSVQ